MVCKSKIMKNHLRVAILCLLSLCCHGVSSTSVGCTNSTHFILTYTNFTEIDYQNWYQNCPGANFLNMSHNKFTSVKNTSFNILWNVRFLDLSYNEITVIESGALVGMRSLEELYFSHNQIDNIPDELFSIYKPVLKTVDFSYNQIAHIPLQVFNHTMPALQEVRLHHNLLTAFEPWAVFNQGIKYFDLRWNNISTFTNEYNWTYSTRLVYDDASTDLRYNQLSSWHDWYMLQYKDSANKHVGIEAVLLEIIVDLRDNIFVCDCNMHNLVTRVRASFFRWTNLDYLDLRCYGPPSIRGKRAFYDIPATEFVCNISQDCPTGCLCQDRPEERVMNVDCRDLNLTRVPQTVPQSPYNNITLQFDNNAISTFENVSYLRYVTSISISNNKLTSIPDFVFRESVNGITMVDLSNNSLTSVPESAYNIKYKDFYLRGNNLKCSCDMLWMAKWIDLAPAYADKTLTCDFEGTHHRIIDLNETILNCNDTKNIILIVVMCCVLLIVIALLITAKRCPYTTKVLLYKIFRIHPSDKYQIDKSTDKTYDIYVSFDDNDPYVRQWVERTLRKQLEEKKPKYRMCIPARDAPVGPEADVRLQLIENSRRLLIILSENYEKHEWCQYEMCHAETLDENQGRILFFLYDIVAEKYTKNEPWVSKMKERKVLRNDERMFWSKLRYEMPVKPLLKKPVQKNQNDLNRVDKKPDFTNI